MRRLVDPSQGPILSKAGSRRSRTGEKSGPDELSGESHIGIRAQLNSLRNRLRVLLSNGMFSERGLAALSGISQPHIHHLISGARALTPRIADRLLDCLDISTLDLLDENILNAELAAVRQKREAKAGVPLLLGCLGAGFPPPAPAYTDAAVECALLFGLHAPSLVRVAPDPLMEPMLHSAEYALMDLLDNNESASPEALYAVVKDRSLVIRGIRYGRGCMYLLTGRTWSRPSEWARVERGHPVARVIPLRGYRP